MMQKIRMGDILLAENPRLEKTEAYLVVNLGSEDGFGLICLSCGEKVGFYGENKEKFKNDIEGFLNVKHIVKKETVADFLNEKYEVKYEVKPHDTAFKNDELGIEVRL